MCKMIFSAATALALIAIGLTSSQANAQVVQPPKQDCEQAPGIQPSAASQDQSCNTVLKDSNLADAPVAELIQRLVAASPSLGDGPYVRVDLAPPSNGGPNPDNPDGIPNNLDYVTKDVSANQSGMNIAEIFVGDVQDQLGDNVVPARDIQINWSVSQNTFTMSVPVPSGEKGGNQIINECPDGVALIKEGKDKQATVIGEVDMWKNTIAGDPTSDEECGLVFTTDHVINTIVFFLVGGPSGLFNDGNITDSCAFINAAIAAGSPSEQQGPVSHIGGGYAEVEGGFPPGTNRTACFGIASYCDTGEPSGSFNACAATDDSVVGGARATPQITTGIPVNPPPQANAFGLTTESTDDGDQTTTFSGDESGGSLVTCCSF